MKKFLRLACISAMVLCASTSMATTTTVGSEDNTTGWWTAFSDYYTIEPNKTLTLQFKNYSSQTGNHTNWLAVVTTDADRGAEGYAEYCVLRADNWGWNPTANTSDNSWYVSLTSNYNWDIFQSEMDGSDVVMTITRKDARVTIHADITAASGNTYFENFVIDCGDGTQTLRAFLSTEAGHLVIDNDATTITDTDIPEPIVEPEGTVIGEKDNSTGWWAAFSDYFTLQKDQTLTLDFYNYNDGAANYHNWLLGVTTDADRNDDANGYKEYFILRADNYCWGVYGNSNENGDIYQMSSNYNWDVFISDMNGAHVVLTVTRDGAKVIAYADITAGDGATKYFEQLTVDNCDDGEQAIRAFLTVEGGHLVLISSEITDKTSTAIQGVAAETGNTAGVRYNLAGQRVDASYKGVVLENGKKFFIK